jgi:hypothetical protein
MTRLNVLRSTAVYETDVMAAKSKKARGFLKPHRMPMAVKNR